MNILQDHPEADAVYTDEDKVTTELDEHFQPHLKPDFNLDLLRSNNYICHFFVVRRSVVEQVGGFRKEFDGAQDYDFIFRCTEEAREVVHVPEILYHWRTHKASTADNPASKMYAFEAGKRAIEAHLERTKTPGTVSHTQDLGFYRVQYPVQGQPFVSVIIPNKDEKETLETCLESLKKHTNYKNFEIIIVDDGSSDETVSIIQSFHDPRIRLVSQVNGGVSRARNAGMKKAMGAYIAFLDGDDYWYPEHLELAADFFNRHPEILAYANRYMRDELEAIPPRPPSYPESIRRLGIRGVLFMNSSSVILNSSLASRLPPWEEAMPYGEDGLYWTRCMRGTGLIGLGGSVTSIYRQRASSAMHDEHYQHISLHSLIAPLLNELEAMKNPKWQFAVHYLVIRELHPKRLLSLNAEERISLTGRIRKIMHPCLNRPFLDSYMKACSARAGMEQSFSALMDRTMFSCKWLDRLERMGRSLFFRLQTNNGMESKHQDPVRSRS